MDAGSVMAKASRHEAEHMKRFGNLYDEIISIDNLNLADEKARKGKVNTYGVRLHDQNREANILALHDVLKRCAYKTSDYTTFIIHEPKERVIFRLPYYPDRILHHAVMNVLEPIWVKTFIPDTCSCVKKRGINQARKRMQKFMMDQEGTRYCLKTDIRKFYPTIKHEVLKNIVRRKIKDSRLLALLDEVIDSADGLPIGNYMSQYLSNLYLTYLDHKIKEERHIRYYVRYADDMVFMSSDKTELAQTLEWLKSELATLGLELKGNEQIFPIADSRHSKGRGVDFVGFVFYHHQTLIRKSIKKAFARKCAYLNKKGVQGKTYKMAVASWLGWAKYSDSNNLLNNLIHVDYAKGNLFKRARKAC